MRSGPGLIALLALALAVPALGQSATRATPGFVRVAIETSAGRIVVALDQRHAPATTANFLAYVDDGRLDGTSFYRASRRKGAPKFGFVQGGIGMDARRRLPPLVLEPTDKTGLRHLDAVISMAHGADEDSANGNFSIMVGANPSLDAKRGYRGYAAFGKVVAGMDVVKRILALPTGGGRGAMRGQMILKPVRLIRAVRLDGTPKPTGRPKPWTLFNPR